MVWEGRREGRREIFFLPFFLILGIFFSIFEFSFYFVFWVKGTVFFYLCFFHVFGFSDHFWPAPLLAHTTFGPDRLLALTTSFDQTVFCPNLCEPSLTPKNFGQWGCSRDNLLLMSCFWAMDFPVRDPGCPRPPCAGSPLCYVVLLLLCVQNFRGCVQDLGDLP